MEEQERGLGIDGGGVRFLIYSIRSLLHITHSSKKKTYDSKVFPRETSKIECLGIIRQRKVCVICNGDGTTDIKPLDKTAEIERLGKLLKDGMLTDDEFTAAKKGLLR